MNKELLQKYLELLIVISFVFCSGSIGLTLVMSASVVSLLYMFAAISLLFVHKQIRYPSIGYGVLLVYMIIDCYIIHMGGHKEHTAITYSMFYIGTAIIVGTFDFYKFRDLLTNVLYYVTIVGLFVWFLSEFGMIHHHVVNTNGWQYCMVGPYCLGWHNLFHRYAGIWHEPGACMIFMNFMVLMHFKELCMWRWKDKSQCKKVLLFIFATLCTQSTTGYLAIALISAIWILRFKLDNRRIGTLIKILVVLVGFAALAYLCTSDVVIEKLTAPTDGSVQTSKGMRLVENLTLLDIFMSNPIFGAGLGSTYQWDILVKNGAIGCSNGIFYYLSGLGLAWFVPFMFLLVKNLRRLRMVAPTCLILIIFMLLEVNEQYMMLPITLMFFLPFMTYKEPEYLFPEKKFDK